MSAPTIAFIGAGKMATALARGFVCAEITPSSSIRASDAYPAALAAFTESVGCHAADSNSSAVDGADVVVLAVKPQQLLAVLDELRPAIQSTHLVISIAAGIRLASLAERLPPGARIIRVMPNTPCLVRAGASGFSRGPHATGEDAAQVMQLFSAVGVAHELPEDLLDAVTGVSGSGPAFVYTVIEAMTDAGVQAGLPAMVAKSLAVSTVAGAAEMVRQTGDHPALLRNAVTSPGGTTAAGLAALEQQGLRHAMAQAVSAAVERSKELGES